MKVTMGRPQLVFCIVLCVVCLAAAIEARSFRAVASYFPFYFSLVGAAISVIGIMVCTVAIRRADRDESGEALGQSGGDRADEPVVVPARVQAPNGGSGVSLQATGREQIAQLVTGLPWILGFVAGVVAIRLLGTVVGGSLFILGWFLFVHRWTVRAVVVSLVVTAGLLLLLTQAVGLEVPAGRLVTILGAL